MAARSSEAQTPARLTREQVIGAAMRVVTRSGFDGLTMRAVAEELGVTTMAPYRHVKNKHELMIMLVDAALTKVEVPSEGDWEFRLRRLHRNLESVFEVYGSALAVNLELEATPAGRVILDAGRGMLAQAGLDGDDLEAAVAFWQLYIIGRLVCYAQAWSPPSVAPGRRAKVPAGPARRQRWRKSVLSPEYFGSAMDMYFAGIRYLVQQCQDGHS